MTVVLWILENNDITITYSSEITQCGIIDYFYSLWDLKLLSDKRGVYFLVLLYGTGITLSPSSHFAPYLWTHRSMAANSSGDGLEQAEQQQLLGRSSRSLTRFWKEPDKCMSAPQSICQFRSLMPKTRKAKLWGNLE